MRWRAGVEGAELLHKRVRTTGLICGCENGPEDTLGPVCWSILNLDSLGFDRIDFAGSGRHVFFCGRVSEGKPMHRDLTEFARALFDHPRGGIFGEASTPRLLPQILREPENLRTRAEAPAVVRTNSSPYQNPRFIYADPESTGERRRTTSAGTAKVRGSRTRHRILWVGLWVGNPWLRRIFQAKWA
jgi:hypothetical protein